MGCVCVWEVIEFAAPLQIEKDLNADLSLAAMRDGGREGLWEVRVSLWVVRRAAVDPATLVGPDK